ncbi:MAG: CoA transferase [Thermodesulfobacteriota bacterium]|nr:CoA transferase [Thermodesulfobacteriota bacterium]
MSVSSHSNNTQERLLGKCRVLDLTEGGYNFAGKILGDLGADVIRIEPPHGSITRRMPPFHEGAPLLECSFFWHAYNLQKRGITLDLDSKDGRELFKRLVKTADIVLESFPGGYMGSIELDYKALEHVNPDIIFTHMSTFGDHGPHSHYKGSDLINWAMGGMLFATGDPDRPPVRVSFPVSEAVTAAQGAAGTLHAWWHKINTGEGQKVSVSAQETMIWVLIMGVGYPIIDGSVPHREGTYRGFGMVRWRQVIPCKDGHISIYIIAGPSGGGSMRALVQYMDEDGMASKELKDRVWEEWGPADLVRMGEVQALKEIRDIEDRVAQFFALKTKQELFDRALHNRILLSPCATIKDLTENPQLESRGLWASIEHPAFSKPLKCPGWFVKVGEFPPTIRRAPLLGEHNEEIYLRELQLSTVELTSLKGVCAI